MRILKAIPYFQPFTDSHYIDASEKENNIMVEVTTFEHNGATRYPPLDAIFRCYKSIRHAQTVLERKLKPTIIKIIPMV